MKTEICVSAGTVGRVKLLSAVLVPLCGLLAYIVLWNWAALVAGFYWVIFVPMYVCSVLIHEGLHYIGFVCFGGAARGNVKFKFSRQSMTPYVVCREVTSVRRYKVAAILPFVLVGCFPVAFGLIFGNAMMLVVGLFNVSACSADLVLYYLLSQMDPLKRVARIKNAIGFVVVNH